MNDEQILKQLLYGNHLNDKELERALKLNKMLEIDLKSRIRSLGKKKIK